MKKATAIASAVLSAALAAILIPSASLSSVSGLFPLGKKLSQSDFSSSDALPAAAYNGNIITEEAVDYQLYADSIRSEEFQPHYSRKDVIDNLLLGYILLDEAHEAGLSASREDVLNSLALSKEAVAQSPEAAGQLQDFCAGANITIDEYWERLEDQLYGELSRLKYMNAFMDEYLENHPGAERQEADDAYARHRQELLRKHRDAIVYYK